MELYKKNKLIDMTPLLDVILILLFAFLMSVQFEAEEYQEQSKNLEKEMEKVKEEALLTESQLQENISELKKQQDLTNRAIAQFLMQGEMSEELQMSSFEGLLNEETASKSLLQMDLLSKQYFFLEVRIDTMDRHQVYINDEATQIYLSADKRLDESQKQKDQQSLYDLLANKIDYSGKKFSMLTLIESRNQYEYASQLLWDVFSEIEVNYGAGQIYKLQYFQ